MWWYTVSDVCTQSSVLENVFGKRFGLSIWCCWLLACVASREKDEKTEATQADVSAICRRWQWLQKASSHNAHYTFFFTASVSDSCVRNSHLWRKPITLHKQRRHRFLKWTEHPNIYWVWAEECFVNCGWNLLQVRESSTVSPRLPISHRSECHAHAQHGRPGKNST